MTDRTVMITGAAGALGRATAAAFERAGCALVLLDRSMALLQAAYPDARPRRLLVGADLLDETQVRDAADRAIAEFGRIDVLCNIAGGFYYGEPVHALPGERWLAQFHLNATTVLHTAQAVVPHMTHRRRGVVFNIGAAAHLQGHAHMSAYAVAKSAVMRLTESMAEELREFGVSVLCLMPTLIDTPQNRLDMPDADTRAWTPPSAIGELMVLLSDEAAALMSGSSIALGGRPAASVTRAA